MRKNEGVELLDHVILDISVFHKNSGSTVRPVLAYVYYEHTNQISQIYVNFDPPFVKNN